MREEKKSQPEEGDFEESKISNVEWGLFIGALGVVDLVQILLDVLAQVGFVLNRFLGIFVGMAIPFYLHIRGEDMTNSKRLTSLMATFVGEEIPDVDALPLWCLDGFYYMWLSKEKQRVKKIAKKVPGGQKILKMASSNIPDYKNPSKINPLESIGHNNNLRQMPSSVKSIDPTKKQPQKRETPQHIKPLLDEQHQKNGQSSGSGSQQEIGQLKRDIERWKQEKHQLETRATDKKRKYDEHEKFSTDWINTRKEEGVDENQLKGLMRAKEESLNKLWSDYGKDIGRISELEKILWGANNKLIRVEEDKQNFRKVA